MPEPLFKAELPGSERTKAVEKLFFQNYGFITDLSLSDSRLTFDDASMIVEGIAKQLHKYSGELIEPDFQSWLEDIVLPLRDFYAIRRTCTPYVKAAIRKVLGPSVDFGITKFTYEEAELNTWVWCFGHLEELRDPTAKAKPKTRLYAQAKLQALTIRRTLMRTRKRFGGALDSIDPERVGRDEKKGRLVVEPKAIENFNPFARSETISHRGLALNQ